MIAAFLIAAALLLSACGGTVPQPGSSKLTVYADLFILYEFTCDIAGDRVDCVPLIPAGSDPHDWEPTPRDEMKLETADMLILNGRGMEPWAAGMLGDLSNKNITVVYTDANIGSADSYNSDSGLTGSSGADSVDDPHMWLDPALAQMQMQAICDALCVADPTDADFFRANMADYSVKFTQLDADCRAALAPYPGRDLVVTHSAFGYLCAKYGLVQYAVEGQAAMSDPSPATLAQLIDLIAKNGVTAIFYDTGEGQTLAENVAAQTGIKAAQLDSMEIAPADGDVSQMDYFAVMEANIAAIVQSFAS